MSLSPGIITSNIYESDMKNPKTIDDAKLLGKIEYQIPDFVDLRKGYINEKYFFGLTTIRVELTFENPNGQDVVKILTVDHDYHGN